MKKYITFVFILLYIVIFAGCSSNDSDSVITSGSYQMEMEQKENQEFILVPAISIDTDKKEFIFVYDALSSYIPMGTYEINDNVLTATTDDELYHYVFEIIDKDTLSFVKESSSKITVFDEKSSIVPQNGAIFQRVEKE